MRKIYILGSTAIDVTVRGSTVTTSLGGKGSNQAIAARRMGGGVTFATKIGGDAFGRFALETWEREGLSTALCRVSSSAPTGVSVVMLDEQGENRIIRGESASRCMDVHDLRAFADELPEGGIFMTQLSSTPEVALALLRVAKGLGCTTILDPTPTEEVLPSIWEFVDIITPNEAEFAQLGSVPVETQVVTLGANGVRVTDGSRSEHIAAHSIDAVDTTGAGDAFNGAFAVALAEGADVVEAARLGNAAGALCASRRGAALAMPTRAEAESLALKVK